MLSVLICESENIRRYIGEEKTQEQHECLSEPLSGVPEERAHRNNWISFWSEGKKTDACRLLTAPATGFAKAEECLGLVKN